MIHTSRMQHESDYSERGRKVNLRGVFLGCKFACAQFLKQGLDSSERRGWIVNTSSMLGLVGITGGAGEFPRILEKRQKWGP